MNVPLGRRAAAARTAPEAVVEGLGIPAGPRRTKRARQGAAKIRAAPPALHPALPAPSPALRTCCLSARTPALRLPTAALPPPSPLPPPPAVAAAAIARGAWPEWRFAHPSPLPVTRSCPVPDMRARAPCHGGPAGRSGRPMAARSPSSVPAPRALPASRRGRCAGPPLPQAARAVCRTAAAATGARAAPLSSRPIPAACHTAALTRDSGGPRPLPRRRCPASVHPADPSPLSPCRAAALTGAPGGPLPPPRTPRAPPAPSAPAARRATARPVDLGRPPSRPAFRSPSPPLDHAAEAACPTACPPLRPPSPCCRSGRNAPAPAARPGGGGRSAAVRRRTGAIGTSPPACTVKPSRACAIVVPDAPAACRTLTRLTDFGDLPACTAPRSSVAPSPRRTAARLANLGSLPACSAPSAPPLDRAAEPVRPAGGPRPCTFSPPLRHPRPPPAVPCLRPLLRIRPPRVRAGGLPAPAAAGAAVLRRLLLLLLRPHVQAASGGAVRRRAGATRAAPSPLTAGPFRAPCPAHAPSAPSYRTMTRLVGFGILPALLAHCPAPRPDRAAGPARPAPGPLPRPFLHSRPLSARAGGPPPPPLAPPPPYAAGGAWRRPDAQGAGSSAPAIRLPAGGPRAVPRTPCPSPLHTAPRTGRRRYPYRGSGMKGGRLPPRAAPRNVYPPARPRRQAAMHPCRAATGGIPR